MRSCVPRTTDRSLAFSNTYLPRVVFFFNRLPAILSLLSEAGVSRNGVGGCGRTRRDSRCEFYFATVFRYRVVLPLAHERATTMPIKTRFIARRINR